ncbi:MAG TPA: alpha/beta hydrolase domain-containing protein [Acidimicrobiales bacterium]|nr:alpha/beta hydrolase domain-containing protein [Acidimicrobiales bacterium]
MRLRSAGVTAALVLACVAVGCSSGDDGAEEVSSTTMTTTMTTREEGPAAAFGGPLEGGAGVFLAASGPGPALDDAGYAEAEYTAAGTATSYTSAGSLPADGTFELEPGDEAAYMTRVVVRRPDDPAAFNGTVVVEWLNVSGGVDAPAEYTYLADELLRGGYAWVGASAQRIGVEGGPVAVEVPGAAGAGLGRGLRAQDPDRYGDLHHPGDAFSYDIFTQVARALRSPGEVDPLDGLAVERVLAVGESQSAYALTTYVNGVQPLTGAFDGFLVHSRGGAAAPLGEPNAGIDIASTIGGEPTTIRSDIETPVILVETETDVLGILGYLPARQPDGDRLRLWEVAGTAHADKFQVGAAEDALGCAQPINRGQQAYVLRAALRHLDRWVRDGTAPPEAPRLEVDVAGPVPAFVLDDVGNVTGGIRTPAVDAPVDVLSGMPVEDASIICLLMGRTTPLDADRLGELWGSRDEYLNAYETATEEMIDAGFALPEDREALLDEADPARLPA